ncbi:MAG TPA: hypothetical protein DEG47_05930, partial [Cyanobacteria bacterium UBA11148]|nr:hypothetical protein [Cyanobacteria bacterium UBA11148]
NNKQQTTYHPIVESSLSVAEERRRRRRIREEPWSEGREDVGLADSSVLASSVEDGIATVSNESTSSDVSDVS